MRFKSFKNPYLSFSILLIALCFATGVIYNPFNDKSYNNQDDTFIDIFEPGTAVIQPNGKPLTIYQYANISNSYSDSNLPLNVSFTLAQDWTSKNVTIYYDGVSQKKDRVVNGDFDTDISEWTYISNAADEYINRGWDASGNPEGSMVIKTDTGQKLEGEYAYFEQNVSIPEGLGKKDASFTFDYFYNNGFLTFYNVNVYMAIIVGDVEKNKTVDLQYISRQYWDSLSMDYNPSDFGQELPGNLSFRIGFYTSDDTSITNWGDFQIDNVEFNLWTEPSQEGLIRAYDNEFNLNHTYYNTTYGKGYSFLDSERIRNPSNDVIISLYQNISGVLDFSVDDVYILSQSVKILISTFSGLDGCFYTLGEQIEWQTEFSVLIPPNYESWIEIVKPSNWNFTSIKDGYEDEQVEFCEGTGENVKRVIIPHDIVSLGLWKLKAISENYITNGNLEVMEDGQFENSSSLNFGDIFKVSVSLNNSISYTNTLVNCSIYYSNNSILWTAEKEPDSSEIDFGNFTVGLNMTVGQYQVKIFWSNNESSLNRDQIGYTQFIFDVWHNVNLTAIDSYFEMIAGDPLLLKVRLSDCCTNKTIDFATINYNSTYGIYGTMTYQGLGIYLAELDTSSLELGDYYFSFNASKEYYEEISLKDLINLKIIAQPIVLETPHSVINSMANDYAICQVNVTGGHSGTLIWPANISTDWQNPYSVVEHFNGTYTLNFSTSNLPTQGIVETYTISIYANKTNYGTSIGFVTITVQPIQTLVNVNNTIITTEIIKNFEIKVNYTIKDSGDLILEANCSVTWPGSYNVTNLLCDCFIIEFNTEGLNIDTYTAIIKLEKAGYQSSFKSISIIIREQNVETTVLIDSVQIDENSLIETKYNERVLVSCRIYAESDEIFLSGGNTTFTYGINRIDLIKNLDGWYVTSLLISDSNFSLGINSVYLEFSLENYTTTIFSFQIFVEQITIDVETIDFQDSLQVLAGDKVIITLSLKEFGSTTLIENATVFYSWDFGIGYFSHVGDGIYELELTLSENIKGNHKMMLIISTEGSIYKTQEFSILFNVGEKEHPNFIIWIVLAVLLIVSSILGTLSLRSYVIIPAKAKKESKLIARTQRFKDIMNIEAIVISSKSSGIAFYIKNYFFLEQNKKHLISGFIHAIASISKEIATKEKIEEFSNGDKILRSVEKTIELDFKHFYFFICDYNELRIVFILKEKASERFRNLVNDLLQALDLQLSEYTKNWDGNLDIFEELIPPILNNHFELCYKETFRLNQVKYINRIKKEADWNKMELRILNVINVLTGYQDGFYLEDIINTIEQGNKDKIIDALELLIKKKVIIPSLG